MLLATDAGDVLKREFYIAWITDDWDCNVISQEAAGFVFW